MNGLINKKVLIVDDDINLCRSVKIGLRNEGAKSVFFCNQRPFRYSKI